LSVTYIPNSIEARDVATLVHMQTNLRKHQKEGPHVIMRGQGSRVFDDAGRDYIDAVAGLWCASLGFGSERLAAVAAEQMRTLGYYHLYRHRSHEPAVALAETLLKIAPVPMARVVFQCSGSEANDTAVKLAWYYWNAVGEPQRTKIIARRMGYHGSTCAAVSLSGKPDMHAGFALPFAPFKHTEFPHYYRRHEPGETQTQFSDSGGAAQIRHLVRCRRGDLRLCPHRRNVGIADLCALSRHGDLGQGALRRHAAHLGRPYQ
jgi:4-aminobutyrate--pyruvate transaminase